MQHSKQMSESLRLAILLTLSGGFMDAYSYICRDGVFANAQTGNIVLLGINLLTGGGNLLVHYLIPVIAFALGIWTAQVIRDWGQTIRRFHWRQLVLAAEIILLFLVGFIPSTLDSLANAMVSFSCAMQVQSFRKINGYAFASTMCIGNLRGGVEALYAYRKTKNRSVLQAAGRYCAIILLFGLGAGLGGCFIPLLGVKTIWISCLLLLVSLCLMFIEEEEESLASAKS